MTPSDWLDLIPSEYRKYARQYAIEKCEEQKKICADQGEFLKYRKGAKEIFYIDPEKILNAPLPDID